MVIQTMGEKIDSRIEIGHSPVYFGSLDLFFSCHFFTIGIWLEAKRCPPTPLSGVQRLHGFMVPQASLRSHQIR